MRWRDIKNPDSRKKREKDNWEMQQMRIHNEISQRTIKTKKLIEEGKQATIR
jgi:hypothetical protein